MLRKFAVVLAVAAMCPMGQTADAVAVRSKGLTMLVVPARYSVMQVSFDILKKRDVVLVSYQGSVDTETPLLHAWNGRDWVHVSLESYEAHSFLQVTPTQVVLVGDETMLPNVLIEASSWCPLVMNIPTVDTASLVNSFGKLFSFRTSDWRWFALRYNLDLADLNEDRRQKSWYDRPHVRERKTGYVVEHSEPLEEGAGALESGGPVLEPLNAPTLDEEIPPAKIIDESADPGTP